MTINLTDENGGVIYEQSINLSDSLYKRVYLSREIEFTVNSAAETARLSLITRDYYGRYQTVASVDIILIQLGNDLINPAAITQEPYIIKSPGQGQIISGGKVHVSGYIRPVNKSPLVFALVDQKGNVVTEQSLPVTLVDSQQPYTTFSLDVPYSIPSETRVRLWVFQRSDNRLPGVIALNSLTLVIRP